MPEHSDIVTGERHGPCNWEVADEAARLALTPAAGDVGKDCWQESDGSIWKLTDDSPATWLQIAGPALVLFAFGDGKNTTSLEADQTCCYPKLPAGAVAAFYVNGDAAGSCVVDIQASARATTSWASICAGTKPTLSSDDYAEDLTPGWTDIDAAKKYRAVLESVSGLKQVSVLLEVKKKG